jgi:hypothetical protein
MLTDRQAEHILRLWKTREFDSVEIAEFVRAGEPDVCRIIQAARDLMREFSTTG